MIRLSLLLKEEALDVLFVDEFTITNSRQDESGYRVNLKVAVYVKKPQADKATKGGSG